MSMDRGLSQRSNFAIRMAAECIPIAAIARIVQEPREMVRDVLQDARAEGYLAELPAEDWPPGQAGTVQARPVQVRRESRADFEERCTALQIALIERGVRLTASEGRILLLMTDHEMMAKGRLHELVAPEADMKVIDVFVCKLRKRLALLQLRIETIWGRGYRLDAASRRTLAAMLAGEAGPSGPQGRMAAAPDGACPRSDDSDQ
jgi:DNA-binding winged helix-turn-helix (wHTH) protein